MAEAEVQEKKPGVVRQAFEDSVRDSNELAGPGVHLATKGTVGLAKMMRVNAAVEKVTISEAAKAWKNSEAMKFGKAGVKKGLTLTAEIANGRELRAGLGALSNASAWLTNSPSHHMGGGYNPMHDPTLSRMDKTVAKGLSKADQERYERDPKFRAEVNAQARARRKQDTEQLGPQNMADIEASLAQGQATHEAEQQGVIGPGAIAAGQEMIGLERSDGERDDRVMPEIGER